MSDVPQGPGWWQAADGRWYPPAAGQAPPGAAAPGQGQGPGAPAPGTPAPGLQGSLAPPTPIAGTPGPPPGGYAPPPGTPAPPPGGYGAAPFGPPSGAFPPGGAPPPGGGYPPPPPAPGGKGGPSGAVVGVIAVLVVLIFGGGIAAFFLTRGSDDDDAGPTTTTEEPAADALLLQPLGVLGPDPFGDSFATADLPSLSGAAADAATSRRSELTSDSSSGALIGRGSDPGLYGGSRDNQVCDALAIADFLDGEPDKAAAFASVVGVSPSGLRSYLGGLTPVILASDTWVTNHGFSGGEATPFQAVLEAGSAVLVDATGVPRVRCECGNPLAPPERDGRSTSATEGDAWDGFAADQVAVVEAGDEVSTFTLLDVESGDEFDRAVGAGQTGEVQVTLQWDGDADLDLHVFDPAGDEVYFANRSIASGGELDIDVIPGCGSPSSGNTENVFWTGSDAPTGAYRVVVDSYSACGAASNDFRITVIVGGAVQVDETSSVTASGDREFSFTVG